MQPELSSIRIKFFRSILLRVSNVIMIKGKGKPCDNSAFYWSNTSNNPAFSNSVRDEQNICEG